MTELVERVARAVCIAAGQDPDHRIGVTDALWEYRRGEAGAAIAAMDEVQAKRIAELEGALAQIANGRTIRFTGSEHHGKPLRDKDAQQIARTALAGKDK